MLTKGDDYPIHQTPDPIAFSGSDRNFYDRYFFNGYTEDGDVFFAAAFGVYPNLNIADAAFGVRLGDRQYNLHASRTLGMERMDLQVGPISIEVLEPLHRLRVLVADNEHGIAADLVFEGRHAPIEEPRSIRRHGPRVLMDFTRLTQLGHYDGWISAGGRRIACGAARMPGTRDRSWGVRAIGLRDPQPMEPPMPAQFHWYWLPAHLQDRILHFYHNEDAAGAVWNSGAVMVHDDGRVEHLHGATVGASLHPGTRWPRHGVVVLRDVAGAAYRVEIEPAARFYLSGLGYMNPDWGHGHNKGQFALGCDEMRLEPPPAYDLAHAHAEAFAKVSLTTPEGQVIHGVGTFESLSMGPNAARGLAGLLDGAPPAAGETDQLG